MMYKIELDKKPRMEKKSMQGLGVMRMARVAGNQTIMQMFGDPDSETEVESDSETEVESDSETEVILESGIEIDSDSGIEIGSESEIEMDSESGLKIGSESEIEMDSESGIEIGSDWEIKKDSDSKPDVDSDIEIEMDSDSEMKSNLQSTSDSVTDTNSDSGSEFEWGSENDRELEEEEKQDLLKQPQYLNPKALRENLGGQSGGEAHHIIPSCVAKEFSYDADKCNEAWNGILLPGSPPNIHPLNEPKSRENLPYHRNSQYDHPSYNRTVKSKLRAKGMKDAKELAAKLKMKILALGAGKFIDNIT